MLRALYDVASNTTQAVAHGVTKQITEVAAQHPLVGKVLTVGQNTVRIRSLIAEGGYSFVFHAKDVNTGQDFALKKMVCQDREMLKLAQNEVAVLTNLPQHPNIVRCHGTSQERTPPHSPSSSVVDVFLLLELCTGGHVVGILEQRNRNPLDEREIWKMFGHVCGAVAHLHAQSPPVVHRDLKIENILLSGDGTFKLCDFGSCTTKEMIPTGRKDILEFEEEIQRMTTLAYRSPEMVDLYQMHKIHTMADVWALGCILYRLAFFDHPFEDGSNLKIINAVFSFPNNPEFKKFSPNIRHVISSCLRADPSERPTAAKLVEVVRRILAGDSEAVSSLRANTPQQQQKPAMPARQTTSHHHTHSNHSHPKIHPNSQIHPNSRPQHHANLNPKELEVLADTSFFDNANTSSTPQQQNFHSQPQAHNQQHQPQGSNAQSFGGSFFDDFGAFVEGPSHSQNSDARDRGFSNDFAAASTSTNNTANNTSNFFDAFGADFSAAPTTNNNNNNNNSLASFGGFGDDFASQFSAQQQKPFQRGLSTSAPVSPAHTPRSSTDSGMDSVLAQFMDQPPQPFRTPSPRPLQQQQQFQPLAHSLMLPTSTTNNMSNGMNNGMGMMGNHFNQHHHHHHHGLRKPASCSDLLETKQSSLSLPNTAQKQQQGQAHRSPSLDDMLAASLKKL